MAIDRVLAAGTALGSGNWTTARAEFEAALAERESPEALEGLGRACWWLDDVETASQALERAYRLYRERGDDRSAARLACQLAQQAGIRGEPAVHNGWKERARRLLSDVEDCAEQAILDVHLALFAFIRNNDPRAARAHAVRGRDLAQRFGLVDLQMLAVAIDGASLVAEGDVSSGMGLLDEATVAALGGEMRDVEQISLTCCFMIFACERVRDFDRAGQWCARMKEFCDRNGLLGLAGVCRTHYASVLTERGEWREAEAELLTARQQLAMRRGQAADAVARLGELRRRQGRFDEAASLLDRVEFHPKAQIGQAALALDLGDPQGARGWSERFLRQVSESDRMQRAHGLELLAQARAALGDLDGAHAALGELVAIARNVDSELLAAGLAFACGVVEAAAGAHEFARAQLEDAVDRFEGGGLPFEAAEGRTALAGVLRALGQAKAADREARRADELFEQLGVSASVRRVGLRAGSVLTAREVEVLRLIADGLSDREIAERLMLSPHTVHRHVSNILLKLGLSSRTSAAAHAARQDLV